MCVCVQRKMMKKMKALDRRGDMVAGPAETLWDPVALAGWRRLQP